MKRKTQKKYSKDNSINTMEPLQLDKLGTTEDVCFGKHHDPTADECMVCGDAEICSIVCSQKLRQKRKAIEEEKSFKDKEKLDATWKDVSKRIKKILKLSKYAKGLPLPQLKTKVVKKLGIHESKFDLLFLETIKRQPKIKLDSRNIVTYKP